MYSFNWRTTQFINTKPLYKKLVSFSTSINETFIYLQLHIYYQYMKSVNNDYLYLLM